MPALWARTLLQSTRRPNTGAGRFAATDGLSCLYFATVSSTVRSWPLPARTRVVVKFISAAVAATQMAALVASGGFSLLHWGLFALISLAMLWLSRRDPLLQRLPAVGTAIALLLLLVWPHPLAGDYVPAALALGLIYALPALYRIGDCVAPRLLAEAVFDGHRLAREIDAADPEVVLPYLRERPADDPPLRPDPEPLVELPARP